MLGGGGPLSLSKWIALAASKQRACMNVRTYKCMLGAAAFAHTLLISLESTTTIVNLSWRHARGRVIGILLQ
jgi:hypothetical protein